MELRFSGCGCWADGLQQVHGLLFGQNALRRLHGGRQGLKAVLPGAEIPIAGSQKEVGGRGLSTTFIVSPMYSTTTARPEASAI